jgi:hypothetical protein
MTGPRAAIRNPISIRDFEFSETLTKGRSLHVYHS